MNIRFLNLLLKKAFYEFSLLVVTIDKSKKHGVLHQMI